MPNLIPAAAKGLPEINRRYALAVTGAGLTAALLGMASTARPTSADSSPTARLIAAHQHAEETAEQAWNAYGDLEEANPIPEPKVQYGRLNLGYDDETGAPKVEPLYAYDEPKIEEVLGVHERAQLSMATTDEAQAMVRETYRVRREKLIADLRTQQAEYDRLDLETGMLAAREAATVASNRSSELLATLLGSEVSALDDARQIAAHVMACYAKGICSYEALEAFLKNLGGVPS